MNLGDRAKIKVKRLGANLQPENAYIWGTVIQIDSGGFAVKYDTPQNGYEYMAIPLNPIPEHVEIIATLTIRFEVHNGDVTDQYPWPLGQTSMIDVVQVYIEHGKWTISGDIDGWLCTGEPAETKIQAILNYWARRLG